jgi:two-component system, NarL family, invasion response regulator UvrY
MTRILIADDHEIVREGLKRILQPDHSLEIVAEAANATDLLGKIKKAQPDIIILDINMPGRSGLDVIRELKTIYPQIPVLILTVSPEELFAIRALRSGASGYITKLSSSAELVNAIKRVAEGGKYLSPALAARLVSELDKPVNREPHELLSDREFEVMCKLAMGYTLQRIANELSLSISSINTYRLRVLEKMKMKSNMELTRYALDKNLID